MADFFNGSGVRIINADVIEGLREIADESVHLVVTSPPYFSHRSYPGEPVIWAGDSPLCADGNHNWVTSKIKKKRVSLPPEPGDGQRTKTENEDEAGRGKQKDIYTESATCSKCGCWRGFLGNEETITLYVKHIVFVCSEVKRVLRKDGTFWLNLGDSYIDKAYGNYQNAKKLVNGNLAGIPWRVALALQDDGWILRSAPPWIKRSGKPESQIVRPQLTHEHWFMFTKSQKSWFDMDAVRRPHSTATLSEIQKGTKWGIKKAKTCKPNVANYTKHDEAVGRTGGGLAYTDPLHTAAYHPDGRGWRTTDFFFDALDWLIEQETEYLAHLIDIRDQGGMMLSKDGLPVAMVFNTVPFSGEKYIEGIEHFAAYNPKMIRPIILSSCPQRVCSRCGAPYIRRVEKSLQAYIISPDGANDGTNNKAPYAMNNPHRGRLRYRSKYTDESYGQKLEAFQRANSIAGGRERSRVEAQEMWPGNEYAIKLYVRYIHNSGEASKNAAIEYVETELLKKQHEANSGNQHDREAQKDIDGNNTHNVDEAGYRVLTKTSRNRTAEWLPSCECNAPSKNGVVLDIFGGSGATGQAAVQIGRDAILIDQSTDYCRLMVARITANSQMELV